MSLMTHVCKCYHLGFMCGSHGLIWTKTILQGIESTVSLFVAQIHAFPSESG